MPHSINVPVSNTISRETERLNSSRADEQLTGMLEDDDLSRSPEHPRDSGICKGHFGAPASVPDDGGVAQLDTQGGGDIDAGVHACDDGITLSCR